MTASTGSQERPLTPSVHNGGRRSMAQSNKSAGKEEIIPASIAGQSQTRTSLSVHNHPPPSQSQFRSMTVMERRMTADMSSKYVELHRIQQEQQLHHAAGRMSSQNGNDGSREHLSWKARARRLRKNVREGLLTVLDRPTRILIAPLVIFFLLVIGGVVGVMMAARSVERKARQDAKDAGEQVALALARALEVHYAPVVALGTVVQLNPSWDFIQPRFYGISSNLLASTDILQEESLVLELEPFAVVRAVYPPNSSAQSIIGLNSLNQTLNPERYATARALIEQGVLNFFGPLVLAEGGVGLLIYQPIFIANVSADDYFGLDPNPGCDFPACYNNGTRFWGFASAVLDWTMLIRSIDHPLKPYDFRLERSGFPLGLPTSSSTGGVILAKSSKAVETKFQHIVEISLPGDTVWRLYISAGDAARVGWRAPLIAAVILASLCISLLVVMVLLTIERHAGLLRRLLPKNVLRKLALDELFLEKYAMVSVFFSDIKGFTTLSDALEPIEIVSILNRQNDHFEVLCEKHGCHKMDIIGDSCFAVAGCPRRMDPSDAARGMANLALDLVEAVSTIRLETRPDIQIEIRCGINSGPIFAHTIGRLTPRFTLIGQTVNIASRMESTGAPSRLHVSKQTAMLLMRFPDEFRLIPRGMIDVKGVGHMETFFVERLVESTYNPAMVNGSQTPAFLNSSYHMYTDSHVHADRPPDSYVRTTQSARPIPLPSQRLSQHPSDLYDHPLASRTSRSIGFHDGFLPSSRMAAKGAVVNVNGGASGGVGGAPPASRLLPSWREDPLPDRAPEIPRIPIPSINTIAEAGPGPAGSNPGSDSPHTIGQHLRLGVPGADAGRSASGLPSSPPAAHSNGSQSGSVPLSAGLTPSAVALSVQKTSSRGSRVHPAPWVIGEREPEDPPV